MNPPLSDVCIVTSAAPCYLPPYKFTTTKVFNLVDGGVAANNPVSCYNPIKTSICVELDKLVQNPMSFRSMKEKLIYDFLFSGLNMVSNKITVRFFFCPLELGNKMERIS